MTFLPGKMKTGGRQKGSLNKRSERAIEILEDCKFCPIRALVKVIQEASKQYEHYREKEHSGRISPMEDNASKYLKIMADSTKDLAGYVYPKLKAIEQTKSDSTIDVTPEQRLESMRQAVLLLEAQVKSGGS